MYTGSFTAMALLIPMVVLAGAAVAGVPPGGTFVDDDGNIHEGSIEAIAAEGITKGCNPPINDVYCPAGSVTRGQMAAFLVRALKLPASPTDHFTDDDGSVFEADINRLAEAGITKGCNPPTNDLYCPDGKVTRGQMAAFLVRAFGYTDDGGGGLFTDTSGSIFARDIDRLATAGVTKGCNPPVNDRYCPESLVLRDQMASFLTRALGLSPMVPPVGFIGIFENFDPPPDNSHVTLTIGPTGSDHKVEVVVFDEAGTVCLNNFGEFSSVTFSGIGIRLDPTHIDNTFATAVCHTSGGDRDLPGIFAGVIQYDPIRDVIGDGFGCFWRVDGGSAADC
jgi:hypothetical protein